MRESYFIERDGGYLPQPVSRGPWDPNSLSGSVIVSLLAFAIEQAHDMTVYMPARLTVDMYRLPDFSPIEIRLSTIRDGYRIKVVDAEFIANDTSMARASCQLLRKTVNADTRVWQPPAWDVPAPDEIDAPEDNWGRKRRIIEGGMGAVGRKRMWLAEQRDIVQGYPLTPWMRAAMVADLTNPWANSGEGGLGYINSDVTMYLHRLPVDEWIGVDVVNHQASEGVAMGECWIYDQTGLIGTSTVAALAQRKGR